MGFRVGSWGVGLRVKMWSVFGSLVQVSRNIDTAQKIDHDLVHVAGFK